MELHADHIAAFHSAAEGPAYSVTQQFPPPPARDSYACSRRTSAQSPRAAAAIADAGSIVFHPTCGTFVRLRKTLAASAQRAKPSHRQSPPYCPQTATAAPRRCPETARRERSHPARRLRFPFRAAAQSPENVPRPAAPRAPRPRTTAGSSVTCAVAPSAVSAFITDGQIAGLVVDDCDHSSPFVLGSISPSCLSREQATRSARANALKSASILW